MSNDEHITKQRNRFDMSNNENLINKLSEYPKDARIKIVTDTYLAGAYPVDFVCKSNEFEGFAYNLPENTVFIVI